VGGCLDPSRYAATPACDLLAAAARGQIGLDHRLLHALVDDPARSLPEMLRFALEDRGQDRVVLEEDLVSIFRHLKTPEALPYFIELVRRRPHDISDELVEAFSLFPQKSTELLLDLYRELGEEEGEEVAFLLASLRVRNEEVLKTLLARLESDPGEAAFCLGLYGDPAARPALERLLTEDGGKIEDWARRSVQEAIADLDLPEPQTDHPAFDIWETYPEQAPPQFSILTEPERLELLSSSSAEFRAGAAASFLDEDLSEPVRQRLLEMGRNDPEPSVRASAWEALATAVDRPDIREALFSRLTGETAHPEERCGALVGLASEADDPVVRRWMTAFYQRPDMRAKALEAMRRSYDRRFAAHFPPHLDDPDPKVRRQAIWGVGQLGIQTEAARLRTLFDNEEFREDALLAYTLSVPAEISRGRARQLLRKVENAAGGLSLSEAEIVQWAIDRRLELRGLDPVFSVTEEEEPPEEIPEDELPSPKPGRNDPCPCGSGKKYKKCCGG
jgi:HEAT repeat protein